MSRGKTALLTDALPLGYHVQVATLPACSFWNGVQHHAPGDRADAGRPQGAAGLSCINLGKDAWLIVCSLPVCNGKGLRLSQSSIIEHPWTMA